MAKRTSFQVAYDKAIETTIRDMEREGRRIIKECVNERTYEHDTKNLYDSYGFGVYYQGKLVKDGYLGAPQATGGKDWYGKNIEGRTEIFEFLTSEHKSPGGMELVVAAAMPYAEVLEKGSAGLKKK